MSSETANVEGMFLTKYIEFCEELKLVYPEKAAMIDLAKELPDQEKKTRFIKYIVPKVTDAKRNPNQNPGVLLPGVLVTNAKWAEFSPTTKQAIHEFLTVLTFCSTFGAEGMNMKWAEQALNAMKEKFNTADFKSLSDKIMDLMQSGQFSSLPERLMKGQIARLAEDLVKEFKPEDFGLTAEELQRAGSDPTQAFGLLSQIYTRNPAMLQTVMKRIAKRLQEKVQRGELRPQELAAEAEELMKEFTENPAMKELMESFKGMFGMDDPDVARAAGRDGSSRLNIVRERLRKKMEAKKQGK
jgi:hypothetical protein